MNVRHMLSERLHTDEHGCQRLHGHVGFGEVVVSQHGVAAIGGGAHEGREFTLEVAHNQLAEGLAVLTELIRKPFLQVQVFTPEWREKKID